MSSWSVAIEFVLKSEGGYANDPDDPGKETYRGISRRYHPDWYGWSAIDQRKPIARGTIFPDLEMAVRDWYYNEFWLPVRGPEIPGPLALCLFDFAVLSGAGKAIRFMQQELGVTPALGNFREVTMNAVRAVPGTYVDLARRITMRRADDYGDATERAPKKVQYLGGWTSRLVDLAVTFATMKV